VYGVDQAKRAQPGRAGVHALSLLSIPFNAAALTALGQGPRPLIELRRETGSPPQTTMRGHLRALAAEGVVAKTREKDFPGRVDYELTESGQDLLLVAKVLANWLADSPDGPTELGGNAAKNAIRALAEGWGTNIIRALATRPLTLTELDTVISGLSYPSLERRLGAMRTLRQIEPMQASSRGTPYTVTDWLRKSIAPLTAAARWERRRMRERAPAITNRDVEAAFLMALPLLRMPADASGSCRLAVRTLNSDEAGVIALVRDGTAASCGTRLDAKTDAWALGPSGSWLSAIIECDVASLEIGGRADLAGALVEGLHGELFGNLPVTQDN
jgi:DNA-binding HxlR family transcriptional regulator